MNQKTTKKHVLDRANRLVYSQVSANNVFSPRDFGRTI